MALKGKKRTTAHKAFIAVITFLGFIGVAGVANFLIAISARRLDLENTSVQDVVAWVLYIGAAVVGLALIWLAWQEPTPEQAAQLAKARADRIADPGAPKTPKFDEAIARDKAARDAFMAESLGDVDDDRAAIEADWEAVGRDFTSGLATDLRGRR